MVRKNTKHDQPGFTRKDLGGRMFRFLQKALQWVRPKFSTAERQVARRVSVDTTKTSGRILKQMIEDLALCAEGGDVEGIKALLAKGADPNAFWHDKFTPLMLAAKYGHEDAVKALLPVSDARLAGLGGDTALMLACVRGKSSVLRLLMPVSDARAVNHYGRTALMIAGVMGITNLVAELLPVSDVEIQDHKGMSALDLAKIQGVINSGSADAAGAIEAWTEAQALSSATRTTKVGTQAAPVPARRARSL